MITYFIQVSFCWLVFHLIYVFFLRKETFFHINRGYLLLTLVLGLCLPLLRFLSISFAPTPEVAQIYVQPVAVSIDLMQVGVEVAQQSTFSQYAPYLWYLYGLVTVLLFGRFLYGLYQIWGLYQDATISGINGTRLARTKTVHLPFSFGNTIFWSEDIEMPAADFEKIMQHEEGHIKGWHTADVLFLELLSILFWCSPPIWLYRKSLKEIHEFLADAFVLDTTETKQYGYLLLRQAQPGLQVALANHFFHSQLKNRIAMMTKSKSQGWKQWKYAIGFSVFALLLMAFSLQSQSKRMQFFKDHPELVGKSFSCGLRPLINNGYNATTAKEILEHELTRPSGAVRSGTGESISDKFEKTMQVNQFHGMYRQMVQFFPEHKAEIEEIAYQVADRHQLNAEFDEYTIKYNNSADEVELFESPVIEQTSEFSPKTIEKQWRAIVHAYQNAATKEAKINHFNIAKQFINDLHRYFSQKIDVFSKILILVLDDVKDFPFGYSVDREANIIGIYETEKTDILEMEIVGEGETEPLMLVFIDGKEQASNECLSLGTHKIADMIHLSLEESIKKYGDRGKNKIIEVIAEPNSDPIYKVVDEMPRFPGCEDQPEAERKDCAQTAMLQFIYTSIKYPQISRENKIQGTSVVRFTVDKDGSILAPEMVRTVDEHISKEVLRVVNEMPKWIPGKQNGKAVKVYFHLPVKFKLEGDDSAVEKSTVAEQLDLQNFKLYPNPAQDEITITFDALNGAIDLSILDVNGKEYALTTKSINISGGVFEQKIDITNFPKGMLVVRIVHENKVFTEKIIRQ